MAHARQRALNISRGTLKNYILRGLPAHEREALLAEADEVVLPAGKTVASAGEPIATVFFPETGVISAIGEMTTGQHVTVRLIGAEGAVGLGPLLGVTLYPHSLVVLLRAAGHRLPVGRFLAMLDRSPALRTLALEHVGRVVQEISSQAACGRVHSHRQRLARWLLVTADKAQQLSLPVTHDEIAQMVGGPRHAVTVAVNDLTQKGAIAHLRGRIDILNRSRLIADACECYEKHLISSPGVR
jgi:CRP-like cAMP-binding protein